MKQTILWFLLAAGLVLAYALYRSASGSGDLQVEPHAAEEIDKAKRQ